MSNFQQREGEETNREILERRGKREFEQERLKETAMERGIGFNRRARIGVSVGEVIEDNYDWLATKRTGLGFPCGGGDRSRRK